MYYAHMIIKYEVTINFLVVCGVTGRPPFLKRFSVTEGSQVESSLIRALRLTPEMPPTLSTYSFISFYLSLPPLIFFSHIACCN